MSTLTRWLIVAGIASSLIVAWEMNRVAVWLQTVARVLDGGCIH